MVERAVTDARDGIDVEGGRDDEGGWAGTGAAGDGGDVIGNGVVKASVGERARTARCSEAHGEQQGQGGGEDSLCRHRCLLCRHDVPGTRGATVAVCHVETSGGRA